MNIDKNKSDLQEVVIKTIRTITRGDNLTNWKIHNMDCYIMTRLLFEDLLPALHLNSEKIKKEILESEDYIWEKRKDIIEKYLKLL